MLHLAGTTEWSKVEGIAYSPKRNSVFFAVSDVRYGMEDNAKKGKKDEPEYDIGAWNPLPTPPSLSSLSTIASSSRLTPTAVLSTYATPRFAQSPQADGSNARILP